MTGLWQVEERQSPSFDSYISLDTAYVENWSLWLDLKILVRTVGVVQVHCFDTKVCHGESPLLDRPSVSNCITIPNSVCHCTGSICPSVSRTLRANALSPNGFCKKAVCIS